MHIDAHISSSIGSECFSSGLEIRWGPIGLRVWGIVVSGLRRTGITVLRSVNTTWQTAIDSLAVEVLCPLSD
jgi:hypothetical protein